MAGKVKRIQFAEGTETTKPVDLTPQGPGLVNVSITDADSPYTVIENRRILADTTAGVIAATTPASPADGDRIQVIDNGAEFDTYAFTLTAAGGQTVNGGASDLLEDEGGIAEYVFDSANSNWVKLSFGGGAGGLSNDSIQRVAAFTAEADTEYFLKTDAGTFQVELPVGAAGVRIKLLDSTGFWSANPPTVVDNGFTGFNGVADSPLELNVPGSWIEFVWNDDDSEWEIMGPQAIDETLSIVYEKKGSAATISSGNPIATFTTVVGRTYKMLAYAASSTSVNYEIQENGVTVAQIVDASNSDTTSVSGAGYFTATGTSANFQVTAGTHTPYNASENSNYAILEEVRSLQTQVVQWETKDLGGVDFSTNNATFMTFNTVVGRTYTFSGTVGLDTGSGASDDSAIVYVVHDSVNILRMQITNSTNPQNIISLPCSVTFVATATTATLDTASFDTNSRVMGGTNFTQVTLTEQRPLESITTATATTAGLLPNYSEQVIDVASSPDKGEWTGGTIKATRIGSLVTITCIGITHGADANAITANGTILNSEYIPSFDVSNTADYNQTAGTTIFVYSTGNIQLRYRNETGEVSQTGTTTAHTISYNV